MPRDVGAKGHLHLGPLCPLRGPQRELQGALPVASGGRGNGCADGTQSLRGRPSEELEDPLLDLLVCTHATRSAGVSRIPGCEPQVSGLAIVLQGHFQGVARRRLQRAGTLVLRRLQPGGRPSGAGGPGPRWRWARPS